MELTTIESKEGKYFKGVIIGKVVEGETEYTIAITAHGGIWYRGDWILDKWNFLSEKAFTERFPELARKTLGNGERLKQIKADLDSVGLLSF